jgi:hypothetical protein
MTMDDLARLDDFIQGHEISMHLEKVASNPILAGDGQGEALEHYRCRLLRPGKRLDVYLSIHAGDQPLTLFDVLFVLALDASGCGMMAGFERYRDKWNGIFGVMGNKLKEVEFFWEELEGRCRQSEALREFLGVSAYEELLALFGLEEERQAAMP